MQFEYNCTQKWLNCTWLHLVQLLSHFLMQLFPNCTQKHVITYTNYYVDEVWKSVATHCVLPSLPALLNMIQKWCLKINWMHMVPIPSALFQSTLLHKATICCLLVSHQRPHHFFALASFDHYYVLRMRSTHCACARVLINTLMANCTVYSALL